MVVAVVAESEWLVTPSFRDFAVLQDGRAPSTPTRYVAAAPVAQQRHRPAGAWQSGPANGPANGPARRAAGPAGLPTPDS